MMMMMTMPMGTVGRSVTMSFRVSASSTCPSCDRLIQPRLLPGRGNEATVLLRVYGNTSTSTSRSISRIVTRQQHARQQRRRELHPRPAVSKIQQQRVPHRQSRIQVRDGSTSAATKMSSRRKATLAVPQSTAASVRNRLQQQQQQRPPTTQRRSVLESMESVLRKPRTVPVPRWISPRHYNITLSECLGHSSFMLVAISYAVDDFLMLRIIAVAGSTAMLFFTYFHPHGRVLWLPFKWNALFIATNLYRIGRVYLDRYSAEQLSDEFLNLRNNNFYLMSPVDFANLARLGTVEQYREGEVVVTQGTPNRFVRLVLDGEFRVMRDGDLNYLLGEANFISEAGLHAGLLLAGEVESCSTVVAAKGGGRVLRWDRTHLTDLMARDASVRRSLKAVVSWDIVRKLKAQRGLLSSGQIQDPESWTERRNDQTVHRYASILNNILSSDDPRFGLDDMKKFINKYRMIHDIDDDFHVMALNEIGWSRAEYEAGHKDGDDPPRRVTRGSLLADVADVYRHHMGTGRGDDDEGRPTNWRELARDLRWLAFGRKPRGGRQYEWF